MPKIKEELLEKFKEEVQQEMSYYEEDERVTGKDVKVSDEETL